MKPNDPSNPSVIATTASPEIAAVVVTYKTARLAIECVNSIARERHSFGPSIRAIVIDNDSGDFEEIDRAVRANDWGSWVTTIAAPKNGGFAYGCNLGVAHAFATGSPDYIHLLNPDTQVRPGGIRIIADFLETHPNVGIAGSSFENPDGSRWRIAFRFPSLFSELDHGLQMGPISRLLKRWVVAREMDDTEQPVDWICGASMLIRAEVFRAIGGLDERYFLYYEETDFCRRANQAGFPTWYVPDSRVMHIRGQSTKVTDLTLKPRRLPIYWFESRRRYFALAFGTRRAIAIDLAAVFGHAVGHIKRFIMRRTGTATPHFVRDLINHSIVWRQNRTLADFGSYPLAGNESAHGRGGLGKAANSPEAEILRP